MGILTAGPPKFISLRDRSTEVLVTRLFATITEVSSLPALALEIIKVANDPVTGVKDLAEVIEQDPALATRIMRAVNSSYYGQRRKVADLKSAVTFLGFNEIRNLAFSAYVAGLFRHSAGHGKYTRRGLRSHMVGAGMVARLTAQKCGKVPPQEAYLAGLLHDIGLILIDQYLHEPFCRVVDALRAETPLCEVEKGVLGFDHARLGEFVAAKWALPEHVAAVIRHHHQSDQYRGPHEAMVHVVELANIFCHLKNRTPLGVRNMPMPSEQLFIALGLTAEEVAWIWERVGDVLEAADSLAVLQLHHD